MKVEIEFVRDIGGHDLDTIQQMYNDWNNYPSTKSQGRSASAGYPVAEEVGTTMSKIAGNWLNDKCINNACWFHNVVTKNNCANEEINKDITGCSPRVEHKQLLNEIMGKEKADKISNDSNFMV